VISGFLALRQAQSRLETMLAIASETSFPCMAGGASSKDAMIKAFRRRLMVRTTNCCYRGTRLLPWY
jgi:hypothetical protein